MLRKRTHHKAHKKRGWPRMKRRVRYGCGNNLDDRLAGCALPTIPLLLGVDLAVSPATLASKSPLVMFFFSDHAESRLDTTQPTRDELRAMRWQNRDDELKRAGYLLIGVSSQSAIELAAFAAPEPLTYLLMSDPRLAIADHLGLPTVTSPSGHSRYEPITIIVWPSQTQPPNGRIVQAFYPADDTLETDRVMRWIREHPPPRVL